MSNKSKSNVPANVETVKTESPKIEKLQELNLDALASKISEKGISIAKQKLYKYPEEGFKSYPLEKSWRNARRSELKRFASVIVLAYTKKDLEGCKNSIKEFKKHYELFYVNNDFSLSSLTQQKNADNLALIEGMLKVIKHLA